MRGEFLRGTGTNNHTNMGSGADVGVHQDGTSTPRYWTGGSSEFWYDGGTREVENSNDDDSIIQDSNLYPTRHYFYQSNSDPSTRYVIAGWKTSRPTNTSVLYCIRVSY